VATKTKVIAFNASYGTLPTSTRTGYTFAGWYTSTSDLAAKVTSTTKMTTAANSTLYAHWTAKTYTVYFSTGISTIPAPASMTVTYGGDYGVLPVLDHATYDFQGWYTQSVGGTKILDYALVSTTGDRTLYAQWK